MGGSTSSPDDWMRYSKSSTTQSQSFSQAYTNRSGMKEEFDPAKIGFRESCNSAANPASTPIIIALDSTGSMNNVALAAKKNIGVLMAEIYKRQPVSDPHIMVQFFDDVFVCDTPLQKTQFEADMVILDQMEKLYWTSNGGGNGSESYSLPLYDAINRVRADAFKEGRKGFLFTIGDDGVPPPLTTEQLQRVYGPDVSTAQPLSYEALLEQAEEHWHVFHLMVEQGTTLNKHAIQSWRDVLGERAIMLSDIDKLSEVLVATMQVVAGADAHAVADSFADPGTALVVRNAIGGLTKTNQTGGVVTL
jgi:hypothetical protein